MSDVLDRPITKLDMFQNNVEADRASRMRAMASMNEAMTLFRKSTHDITENGWDRVKDTAAKRFNF